MEGYRRTYPLRRLVAVLGGAAIGAAGLVVAGSGTAFAQTSPDTITISDGTPIADVLEGDAVTDQLVATFTDSLIPADQISPSADCDAGAQAIFDATINWVGSGTSTDHGTITCGDGDFQVTGSHTYTDSGSYGIVVTVTDRLTEATATKQSDTASIGDKALIGGTAASVTGTEGAATSISAPFEDTNHSLDSSEQVDSGLTGAIAWGDGTTSTGTVAWMPSGEGQPDNVKVTGSHVYDARSSAYNVSVTLSDDGGTSATDTLSATIADAALTAGLPKAFTATAGQSTGNTTVASFTDAAGAQASAADFAASIAWGDSTTSSGTVSAGSTAGAFNVNGTHTYATTGTKSLTITVTDEEGQTVTTTATATVSAAPVILPLTGSPAQPGPQPWPLLYLMLALVGVSVTTVGMVRARKTRP